MRVGGAELGIEDRHLERGFGHRMAGEVPKETGDVGGASVAGDVSVGQKWSRMTSWAPSTNSAE